MAIVPYEPEGSEGNGTTTSDPSAQNGVSESPVDGLSIVPLDPKGINGRTACEKGKKRGRHFDREVRAKILQVCLSLLIAFCFVYCNCLRIHLM